MGSPVKRRRAEGETRRLPWGASLLPYRGRWTREPPTRAKLNRSKNTSIARPREGAGRL